MGQKLFRSIVQSGTVEATRRAAYVLSELGPTGSDFVDLLPVFLDRRDADTIFWLWDFARQISDPTAIALLLDAEMVPESNVHFKMVQLLTRVDESVLESTADLVSSAMIANLLKGLAKNKSIAADRPGSRERIFQIAQMLRNDVEVPTISETEETLVSWLVDV